MNAEQIEKLRLSAVEDCKKQADIIITNQGLTGHIFLNHIFFFSDGKVTFQFSSIEPLEVTSSFEFSPL